MLTFIWRLARFFALLPLTFLRAGFDRVRPRPVVLELLLDGRHPLRAAQGAPWSQRRDGLSRLGLERALRAARRDARVGTVLVRIGHLRGGLAMSTVVACAGFAAVCGSSFATAATMSKVALPPMRRLRDAVDWKNALAELAAPSATAAPPTAA
jgi:hypothetical protein